MDTIVRSYEISYLLTPLVPEDKVGETIDRLIKQRLAAAGAAPGSEAAAKMISLAYPIKKLVEHKGQTFTSAYFGCLRAPLSGEQAVALAGSLKRSPEFLRYLLVRLPREAERSGAKQSNARKPARAQGAPGAAPAAPTMSQEQIDKEIDELLAPVQ